MMDALQRLRVYMHWYIMNIESDLFFRGRGFYAGPMSFEDFCTKISRQTGLTFIDEWIWKYPESCIENKPKKQP